MPRKFHGWAGNYITRWFYLRQEVQEAFDHEMACLDRIAQGVLPFEVGDCTYTWDRHNGGEVTWH